MRYFFVYPVQRYNSNYRNPSSVKQRGGVKLIIMSSDSRIIMEPID